MFDTMDVRITGVSPLLMHNGRGANPMEPLVQEMRELTSKRKKTESDHAAIARKEWMVSVYHDENGHPIIPGELIEATLINGAKKFKLGQKAKAALFCDGAFRVDYEGPKHVERLIEDRRFWDQRMVSVDRKRIMRTRPRFDKWALNVRISYRSDELNKSDLRSILDAAGAQVGLGDFRPKFGRFLAEIL